MTLLAVFSLVRCESEDVWGLSVDELRDHLWEADFSWVAALDSRDLRAAEILRLGREAPYYFSYIFAEMRMPEAGLAEQMRALAAAKSRGVWQEAARVDMLAGRLQREEYAELEKQARRLLRGRLPGLFRLQSERLLIEALYRLSRDRELLQRLAARPPESLDAELKLFEAVAACRLGLPEWPGHFRRLFFQETSSPVHSRALSFLKLEQRQARFTQPVWDYFTAKTMLYSGRTGEAVELLTNALPALGETEADRVRIIGELAAAYFALGDLEGGAEYFLELAQRLAPGPIDAELAALEMGGRLLRKAGDADRAARLLSLVSAESSDPVQRDRTAWFALDIAFKNGRWRAGLTDLAPGWADPDYFADLLHRQAGDSLASGSWQDLQFLYEISRRYGPADVRVRLAYLLGRGGQLGLIQLPGSDAASLLAEAAGEGGYYALLACAAGVPAGISVCADSSPGATEAGKAGLPVWDAYPDPGMTGQEALLGGFFHYGLPLTGYEKILADSSGVSEELLFNAARWLRQQGHVLESIRLAGLLAGRGSFREPDLLYPRAFASEIEARAQQAEIEEALLYALVREESHFDSRIVSSAGAVGLTQIMPETAADLVRWLRLKESETGEVMKARLMDPVFNLQLGTYHLTRLLSRVESSPALALMAYNAGLARLRSWQRRFAGLPADLMVEALPFPETRNYVRKILVSAVSYASLYDGTSPAETVNYIFPDLKGKRP